MDSNKWTIAVGTAFSGGVELKGIFDTQQEALDWADADEELDKVEWTIVEIESVGE